jgi:hypothetical protein
MDHACNPDIRSQTNLGSRSRKGRLLRMTRHSQLAGLGWTAVAFLFVIVVFGVVLIAHTPKWPIYVTILVWWAFVIYTTIHINHEKDDAIDPWATRSLLLYALCSNRDKR